MTARPSSSLCLGFLSLLLIPVITMAQDTVEFLNGSQADGKVLEIRKGQKEFDFAAKIGSRNITQTYPFSKVHAVTMKGKRFELTPKPAANSSSSSQPERSEAEVRALIQDAGTNPPDWFESTPLKYPKTLDLSWPIKPPTKGWQPNKNMGQYIWSVINENPGRWRSGIRLVHHTMTLHKSNQELLDRDMLKLGLLYFTLLQDYPRAAFWFEKGNASVTLPHGVHLAECYWRLGNRSMALKQLGARSMHVSAIKLLGDLGEVDRAIKMAASFGRTNADYLAYILVADALKNAGRLDDAIEYYEKVLASKRYRDKEYEKRFKARARESIETIRIFDKADVSKVADGSYRDSSTGYNGKLSVQTDVADGKIVSVKITSHKEKQFYSSLTDTPAQIIDNQSVTDVDATSGATITSQAIVNATAKALAQGSNN